MLVTEIKQYAATLFRLIKYQVIDKGTRVAKEIILQLIILFFLHLCFLFGGIMLGFILADIIGPLWAGFGLVTLLYLLVAFTFKVFKKGINRLIINAMIKKLSKGTKNGEGHQ